ncbi:MAG: GDP-mannose 4,6-dehydratase [Candidatus Rokubacteria bacterium]|nr:GDP-mannose 4,6-dehydratase [Candidatus Rokubacteria bacterium]
MKVLITGMAGFAGSHLAELALREGADVVGTVLPGAPVANLVAIQDSIRILPCDLTEPGAAARVLAEARPDRVFHLAGASVVGTSWAQRAEVLRQNLEGTFQLLEGLRAVPAPCLLVSSAELYGAVPEQAQPITESQPPSPLSPYALSKGCQELYAGYYVRAEHLPIVIVRAFNHVGPRQGPGFVWSDIARQVAAIEQGLRPPVLEVGTLTTRRDFTDVRDMVRAYWLCLERAAPGEVYNAASGRAVAIREVVDGFVALAGCPIEVRVAPERVRPIDLPLLLGDASRLRALTGWNPRIPGEQSLADVLSDWRQRA